MTKLSGHNSSVQELALNESQNHMISLGLDKCVKIWDVRNYKCLQTL